MRRDAAAAAVTCPLAASSQTAVTVLGEPLTVCTVITGGVSHGVSWTGGILREGGREREGERGGERMCEGRSERG